MTRKEPSPRPLRCPGTCGQDVLARPMGMHDQLIIEGHPDGEGGVCPGSYGPPPPDPDNPAVRKALRLLCRLPPPAPRPEPIRLLPAAPWQAELPNDAPPA